MKLVLDDDFLQKEMTRKQFLQYMTAVLVALLGLGNIISALTSLRQKPEIFAQQSTATEAEKGFGTRKFGV